jgi:hypothetical protein
MSKEDIMLDVIVYMITLGMVSLAGWTLFCEANEVYREYRRKKERFSELLDIEYKYHELQEQYNKLLKRR